MFFDDGIGFDDRLGLLAKLGLWICFTDDFAFSILYMIIITSNKFVKYFEIIRLFWMLGVILIRVNCSRIQNQSYQNPAYLCYSEPAWGSDRADASLGRSETL